MWAGQLRSFNVYHFEVVYGAAIEVSGVCGCWFLVEELEKRGHGSRYGAKVEYSKGRVFVDMLFRCLLCSGELFSCQGFGRS